MRFENKGKGPKGGTYLVCDGARRGLECESTSWRYPNFEASLLAFVREIDLESVVRSEAETSKRTTLDNDIAALRGQIAVLDQDREKIFELYTAAKESKDFIVEKLEGLTRKRIEWEAELREKELERQGLNAEFVALYESKEQIKNLISRLQGTGDDEGYKLRSQISTRLKSLVDTLVIAPAGRAPITRRTIASLLKTTTETDNRDVVRYLSESLKEERQDPRYFLIGFKDGSVRVVYPSYEDPLRFKEQIVSNKKEGLTVTTESGRDVIFPPKIDWPENWYLES
jgi:hypothetical protein